MADVQTTLNPPPFPPGVRATSASPPRGPTASTRSAPPPHPPHASARAGARTETSHCPPIQITIVQCYYSQYYLYVFLLLLTFPFSILFTSLCSYLSVSVCNNQLTFNTVLKLVLLLDTTITTAATVTTIYYIRYIHAISCTVSTTSSINITNTTARTTTHTTARTAIPLHLPLHLLLHYVLRSVLSIGDGIYQGRGAALVSEKQAIRGLQVLPHTVLHILLLHVLHATRIITEDIL